MNFNSMDVTAILWSTLIVIEVQPYRRSEAARNENRTDIRDRAVIGSFCSLPIQHALTSLLKRSDCGKPCQQALQRFQSNCSSGKKNSFSHILLTICTPVINFFYICRDLIFKQVSE